MIILSFFLIIPIPNASPIHKAIKACTHASCLFSHSQHPSPSQIVNNPRTNARSAALTWIFPVYIFQLKWCWWNAAIRRTPAAIDGKAGDPEAPGNEIIKFQFCENVLQTVCVFRISLRGWSVFRGLKMGKVSPSEINFLCCRVWSG